MVGGCAGWLCNEAAHMQAKADGQRAADVAARGGHVMPFSLQATEHIFTRNATGGVQQVVVRNAGDVAQQTLVRQHLREIREQFLGGGLLWPQPYPRTQHAGSGRSKSRQTRPNGHRLQRRRRRNAMVYKTTNAPLINTLHRWFDAQLVNTKKDTMNSYSNRPERAAGLAQHRRRQREVVGDEHTLQPNPWGTMEAAAELVREGFQVFPYCTDDLVTCQRLLDVGCEVLMPWGVPIGSGQDLINPFALRAVRLKPA